MQQQTPYCPKYKVRIVTAASLFDGHDAAINIMRRIIQSTGVEVIHLGHDRSVEQVVNTAIQEDANAIALTSYQGGHNEYFKYMYDLLQEKGAGHIKIFGGGGGVILPKEIEELMDYGITRIYSPDDGRSLGLQGMINDLVKTSDFYMDEYIFAEGTLGAEDFNADVFSVYPNPVVNTLNIQTADTVQNVTVYDVLGKVVMNLNPGVVSPAIDMSSLNAGAYLVNVTINGTSKSVKVIK